MIHQVEVDLYSPHFGILPPSVHSLSLRLNDGGDALVSPQKSYRKCHGIIGTTTRNSSTSQRLTSDSPSRRKKIPLLEFVMGFVTSQNLPKMSSTKPQGALTIFRGSISLFATQILSADVSSFIMKLKFVEKV